MVHTFNVLNVAEAIKVSQQRIVSNAQIPYRCAVLRGQVVTEVTQGDQLVVVNDGQLIAERGKIFQPTKISNSQATNHQVTYKLQENKNIILSVYPLLHVKIKYNRSCISLTRAEYYSLHLHHAQLTVILVMKVRSVISGLLSISSLSTVTAVHSPSLW